MSKNYNVVWKSFHTSLIGKFGRNPICFVFAPKDNKMSIRGAVLVCFLFLISAIISIQLVIEEIYVNTTTRRAEGQKGKSSNCRSLVRKEEREEEEEIDLFDTNYITIGLFNHDLIYICKSIHFFKTSTA